MVADVEAERRGSGESGVSPTPFLIALVLAVVAIGAVLAWNLIRPSNDRLTDSAQVQRTIGQYYGALNKGRYADLVANTCTKDRAKLPAEAGFSGARKAAVEREGEVTLGQDDVTDLTVSGDTAKATLTLRYAKAGDKTEKASFVREGGKWKKCS